MQYGVRSAFGPGPAYFSACHSEVRSSPVQVRSMLFYDPHVKYRVRLSWGWGSLTLCTGTRRSDLFHDKSDFPFPRIRRRHMKSAMHVGEVSCTFRPGTRMSERVQSRPDLFLFLGAACEIWGPIYVVASLAYFSLGRPEDRSSPREVGSSCARGSARVTWCPL